MKYLKLFSIHNLALLSDWLKESGELLVDIYRPHSGGGSFQYLVRSIAELKQLIQKENWHEIVITIFRENPYSLRGVADEKMLQRALAQVEDGEWYTIISLKNNFPKPIDFLTGGNSHSEMQNDFSKFSGQEIGFGQNPFDIYEDEWFIKNSDNVFRLSVTNNRNYNEKYAKKPEKYRWLEKLWSE